MPERLLRAGPRVAPTLTPGQEELGRRLAASYDQTGQVGKLSLEDLDYVNSRTGYEVGRRERIASVAAVKLGGFMDLMRERFKPSAACTLLEIDGGQLFQFWINPDYEITQKQLDVINKIYTLGAGAMHESNKHKAEARRRLTTPMKDLRADPTDPSSPERSILQAIIAGDLDLAISVMDYQIGDFNPKVTAKDS